MESVQCGLIDNHGDDCCACYCLECATWQVKENPGYEYYECETWQGTPFVCENCGNEYQ